MTLFLFPALASQVSAVTLNGLGSSNSVCEMVFIVSHELATAGNILPGKKALFLLMTNK